MPYAYLLGLRRIDSGQAHSIQPSLRAMSATD